MDQGERVDRATRIILAPARTLYRAFIDAEAMTSWRAPDGMEVRIRDFMPREGGGYRMVLRYTGEDAAAQGKTRPGEDEVIVRFAALIPDEKIVELVRFVGNDPSLATEMILTTLLEPDRDGTRVTFLAGNVPSAISPEAHAEGMAASLRKLARLTE